MADSKITALASISTSTDPAVDPLVIVDVSDTSMAATGTTKKVTLNNLLSSSPTATGALTVTGLVTAGSATITGDLTVRTNKLFVNATGVGIGNTGPLSALTVSSQTDARLSVRTTDAVFGSIAGGTALDSLNDAATVLVPFGCRGSTVSFAASGQNVGLQLDASSNVNVPLGNVVMGTSGKGIDFSATAGTGTSELLNDYEEGTWTPVVTAGTGSLATVSNQQGFYTKIGRMVTATGYFEIITNGSGGSYIAMSGLPFVCGTLNNVGVGRVDGTTGLMFQVKIIASTSTANIWTAGNLYPAADGAIFPMTLVYSV